MNKVVTAATLVLLATIGASAYAYTVYLPSISGGSSSLGGAGSGTLNIYLTDSPHSNATLKYLLVNVTSVTLKYSSGENETGTTSTTSTGTASSTSSNSSSSSSTTSSTFTSTSNTSGTHESRFTYVVPASIGTNVNLTKLQGSGLLLGSPKVPAGNVTGIILNITGARAFWTDGSSSQLKVVAEGKLMADVQFKVFANGTTNLTVDVTPGSIHISAGPQVLRPVLLVKVGSSGPGASTETTQTTVTESDTSTSSS